MNNDWTAANDRHNNQPKIFGHWQEEDGEEGRKGAGAVRWDANAQCMRARRERGGDVAHHQ